VKPVGTIPDFIEQLFEELRRRGFALSPDDYIALWLALREGFGWKSNRALRDLCVALWAKSRDEQLLLESLFDQIVTPQRLSEWEIETEAPPDPVPGGATEPGGDGETPPPPPPPEMKEPLETTQMGGEALPSINIPKTLFAERPLILVPRLPLTYREVAQAWRRLRRTTRVGRPVELDIDATITRYSQLGLTTAVVLVPRRKNIANLLILVDRKGAMTPFHRFCDEVCSAIRHSAQLNRVDLYYFNKVPSLDAETLLLDVLGDDLSAGLDPILDEIDPAREGFVYKDAATEDDVPLGEMLESLAPDTDAVIISDADAARGDTDLVRLMNTVAFLKRLRKHTVNRVWLNPLPRAPYDYWKGTTAEQLARHVAMLPMDKPGMYQAVNLLRGQPYAVEKPV
jgi:uncharacterized protein with von Willebrand factor type A (vWA) domain